ncbi:MULTISPECIES: DUF4870 domain-containing protein [unclassified Salinibacterium]|uniref:DUF4870 domain-containing protein n=1 Tax=Salinibacterium sp. GXW1014 TaxID=3377838 RepID=UPI002D7F592A|nr:DUF4870 domain-containing protein [Salinibacterium sp.]
MTNAAPPPPGQYQPNQPMSPADEKLWATLVHVGGIFFSFIPALVGYLVLKDRGPFVREHTRSALNFQISYTIYAVAATIVLFVVAIPIAVFTFGIGFAIVYLAMIIPIAMVVFMIIAAVKANQGFYYRYPLTIEFIKQ